MSFRFLLCIATKRTPSFNRKPQPFLPCCNILNLFFLVNSQVFFGLSIHRRLCYSTYCIEGGKGFHLSDKLIISFFCLKHNVPMIREKPKFPLLAAPNLIESNFMTLNGIHSLKIPDSTNLWSSFSHRWISCWSYCNYDGPYPLDFMIAKKHQQQYS